MDDVIRHNTEYLRRTFSDEYDDFFARQDRVVSSPVNFWISGEYANLQGGMGIKQVLPLRVYCGIRRESNRHGLSINDTVRVFVPSKAHFETVYLIHRLTRDVETLLLR